MDIRESQIEDILVNSPYIAQKILGIKDSLRLIGRQIHLPSGRLDILFTCNAEFVLIELKVAKFQYDFIDQILNYKKDLTHFQEKGKLLGGKINPYLLIPKLSNREKIKVEENNIFCRTYNPEDVLNDFFNDVRNTSIVSLVKNKPIDIGIWNLHLINKYIYNLKHVSSVKKLQGLVDGSNRTLYNKIKFSSQLGLVEWSPNSDEIRFSKLGEKYFDAKDNSLLDRLSDGQIAIVKKFIVENPFFSSVSLGIASMIECVFTLAKNTHPVPINYLTDYFTFHSGKVYDWKTEKAKYHGMRMYTNYSIDLGLLAKSNNLVYLTPEGLKFVMQMQLHKGIKMIENLNFV